MHVPAEGEFCVSVSHVPSDVVTLLGSSVTRLLQPGPSEFLWWHLVVQMQVQTLCPLWAPPAREHSQGLLPVLQVVDQLTQHRGSPL